MYKYKIEQWENEFTGDPLFVSFVNRRGWFFWSWHEIGRAKTKCEAEEICRRHKRPAPRPWLYTEDAI